MSFSAKSNKKRYRFAQGDCAVAAGLVLLCLVFLWPMLSGRLGIFFDDYYALFPRHLFAARSIQGGSLPLWDPTVFAGGRLNYIPQARMWYWPLYPFFLLAPLDNCDAAYTWLIKIPLAIHWVICLLTAYGLGRYVLGLRPPGASVLALVYSFGTGMTGNIGDPQTMYATVWVPLALWGIIALGLRGRRLMGVLGAMALAFIGACGSDPRAIFSWLTVAITVVALALTFVISTSRKFAGRLLKATLLVFIIGILLSGTYWTGMIKAVALYQGSAMVSFARAASSSSSTPYSYLLTLLMPDLFGTLTNAWKIDAGLPEISNYWHIEGNITGGYWLVAICLLGGVSLLQESGSAVRKFQRNWWFIGFFLVVFSILLVTGCYSPVYSFLARICPVVALPYAVRWRIMTHLGFALMAGVSINSILASTRPLSRLSLGLMLFALWVSVLSQWSRVNAGGETVWRYYLTTYRAWLFQGPLSYLFLATAISVLIIVLARRPASRRILIACVALEAVISGFLMTYFLIYRFPEIGDRRYSNPSETKYFKEGQCNPLADQPPGRTGPERTMFYNSLADQMATLHGGFYMAGLYSKPLVERFRLALQEVTEGYPYELLPTQPAARFFPNMSLRYFLLESEDAIPPELAERWPCPASGELYIYRLKETIPFAFSQNRVIIAGDGEQRDELINGDLRAGVFIEPLVEGILEREFSEAGIKPLVYREYRRPSSRWEKEKARSDFSRLQLSNRVLQVDRSSPNYVVIDTDILHPAFLVTTEVWHPGWKVRIDNSPAESIRVNYVQRGVWLPSGRHRVEWFFRPVLVKWGFVCVGLGIIAAILLLLFPARKKRDSVRGTCSRVE